jgi:transcriptional regulator with XRE-family HTH domain
MSGHHDFNKLRVELSDGRREQIAKKTANLRKEMALHELRQARALTQAALGEIMQVEQPAIAKMEKRTDMYVSNLRRFIEAMGGTLSITAYFPEGEVQITNFADMESLELEE